jgi:hypothetical protein
MQYKVTRGFMRVRRPALPYRIVVLACARVLELVAKLIGSCAQLSIVR